jgi:hypothetical protein
MASSLSFSSLPSNVQESVYPALPILDREAESDKPESESFKKLDVLSSNIERLQPLARQASKAKWVSVAETVGLVFSIVLIFGGIATGFFFAGLVASSISFAGVGIVLSGQIINEGIDNWQREKETQVDFETAIADHRSVKSAIALTLTSEAQICRDPLTASSTAPRREG